jgi:phenylpropionate dioxygenase-like ring-hydroxylating dioxygenase large terminal subunit
MFGRPATELGRRLRPVQIELCGGLIFGRLEPRETTSHDPPSLAEYLGDFGPILARITAPLSRPDTRVVLNELTIDANWKICYHLTLDDYHIVEVHADIFGKNGHLQLGSFRYFADGPHSAMFISEERTSEHALIEMRNACQRGDLVRYGYRIFNIFPDLSITLSEGKVSSLVQYTGLAANRTLRRTWLFEDLAPTDTPLTDAEAAGIIFFSKKIADEDKTAAERLQTVAHQQVGTPLPGTHEERIMWFDSVYAAHLAR